MVPTQAVVCIAGEEAQIGKLILHSTTGDDSVSFTLKVRDRNLIFPLEFKQISREDFGLS